jgi:hypothetical protein
VVEESARDPRVCLFFAPRRVFLQLRRLPGVHSARTGRGAATCAWSLGRGNGQAGGGPRWVCVSALRDGRHRPGVDRRRLTARASGGRSRSAWHADPPRAPGRRSHLGATRRRRPGPTVHRPSSSAGFLSVCGLGVSARRFTGGVQGRGATVRGTTLRCRGCAVSRWVGPAGADPSPVRQFTVVWCPPRLFEWNWPQRLAVEPAAPPRDRSRRQAVSCRETGSPAESSLGARSTSSQVELRGARRAKTRHVRRCGDRSAGVDDLGTSAVPIVRTSERNRATATSYLGRSGHTLNHTLAGRPTSPGTCPCPRHGGRDDQHSPAGDGAQCP